MALRRIRCRIIEMKTDLFIRLIFVSITAVLIAGCASTPAPRTSPGGFKLLDRLEGGMEIEEVVKILGEPTSYTEISRVGDEEACRSLNYLNTLIDPGFVELSFKPGLIEIRLDTDLYRSFE